MTKNQKAFLTMIAVSELGHDLLAVSNNGYDVIVGSTAKVPILMHTYEDHPRIVITLKDKFGKPKVVNGKILRSTAAGRYQILRGIFDSYKEMLKLPDFSSESQDKIALQLIKECKAIEDIEEGQIESAIRKCRSRWASLPGAGHGQHENKMVGLLDAYDKALGGLDGENK